jgi:hypothetical protein
MLVQTDTILSFLNSRQRGHRFKIFGETENKLVYRCRKCKMQVWQYKDRIKSSYEENNSVSCRRKSDDQKLFKCPGRNHK